MESSPNLPERRLDILILGPMGESEFPSASCAPVEAAVRELLAEPKIASLLAESHVDPNPHVMVPERINQAEIVAGVLFNLDVADLVIFNLSSSDGPGGEPSPNVFYELALVHALGIPCLIVALEGTKIPFYAKTALQFRVEDFEIDTLRNKLRDPLSRFLDQSDRTQFTENRVTQYYQGLAVVDLSAAVGVGVGYYANFIQRLLATWGYIGSYPDVVKELIVVRPDSIQRPFEDQETQLHAGIARAGYEVSEERLKPQNVTQRGPIGFYHVEGIIIDLPRMLFPLIESPRLKMVQQQYRSGGPQVQEEGASRLRQMSDQLLDRAEKAIQYQINLDAQQFHAHKLHFSTMEKVPELLQRLTGSA